MVCGFSSPWLSDSEPGPDLGALRLRLAPAAPSSSRTGATVAVPGRPSLGYLGLEGGSGYPTGGIERILHVLRIQALHT